MPVAIMDVRAIPQTIGGGYNRAALSPNARQLVMDEGKMFMTAPVDPAALTIPSKKPATQSPANTRVGTIRAVTNVTMPRSTRH